MNQKKYPKRIHEKLLRIDKVLHEKTPVRMDLTHSGWSDIFFLGMDYPEGAKVLNVSIDLAVHEGRHQFPIPPIDTYLRVIDQPVLILTSVDLKATVTLTMISEVFDFAKDYLGLLRAGIIASGIVPIGLEHSKSSLSKLFEILFDGDKTKGLELTTRVNDIPKGSRLAVSTNLLGSIIAIGMRATKQINSIIGTIADEEERRLVAARAILGEWLGGSGGGWQDSGGIWPGVKLIEGVYATIDDPEYGLSRGCLLPKHTKLSEEEAPQSLIEALQDSLVLVHGGMAQNVGPVLEMVTEKYLLREPKEWLARQETLGILDKILFAFKQSDVKEIAQLTTQNFFEPLQTIIPWATNLYTETLVERTKKHFGDSFWGFWMLGGCSGGGMGFIFDPKAKKHGRALDEMSKIMLETKREMEHSLPFAMDPVVYDFSVNEDGTVAQWHTEGKKPPSLTVEGETSSININTSASGNNNNEYIEEKSLDEILNDLGFDTKQHERIRKDYRDGVIGLANNRLPTETKIVDVQPSDVIITKNVITEKMIQRGLDELQEGTIAVVTLAAGVGSRWTQGAGVVKALNPFCKLGGQHRNFLECHLAKSRRTSKIAAASKNKTYEWKEGEPTTMIPHVFTTSYMTDSPIESYLKRMKSYEGPIYRSHGGKIGLRLVPTKRDLKFAWHETQQQQLDEQAQKVQDCLHETLMNWAVECGESSDYRDNKALQCLHPVGHYYEIPNLLLNGTLHNMLVDRPQLKYLMLHNIDTLGANVDPGLLGLFIEGKNNLGFEVIARRIEDRGGGLANINGKTRLVEGMALPNEEVEFQLSYYNSMTTWIDIDGLLTSFKLERTDLSDSIKVSTAVDEFSHQLPTYVTLKEVKKRWGNGQEDIHPVAQFEKLWSDISSLHNDVISCGFLVVPRERGQQLKEVSQLDGWSRDGSLEYVEDICDWGNE